MQSTCNKCQATYQPASDGVSVCVLCGEQSSVPAPVASGSGERRESFERRSPVGESEAAVVKATGNSVLIAEKPAGAPAEVSGLLPNDQPKSPGLAALLSFLLVGMGQIYLGQVEKGLCMLAVVLLLIMSALMSPLGVVILFLNVLDAFVLGRKVKQGQQVGRWQFFFQSK